MVHVMYPVISRRDNVTLYSNLTVSTGHATLSLPSSRVEEWKGTADHESEDALCVDFLNHIL